MNGELLSHLMSSKLFIRRIIQNGKDNITPRPLILLLLLRPQDKKKLPENKLPTSGEVSSQLVSSTAHSPKTPNTTQIT